MSAYSEFSAHSEYPVPEVVPAVAADDKIRCDACPVMCYIKPGMAGACDRYANDNGVLVRVDPLVMLEDRKAHV